MAAVKSEFGGGNLKSVVEWGVEDSVMRGKGLRDEDDRSGRRKVVGTGEASVKMSVFSEEGALWERFLAIKQEGTVAEYRTRFKILSTPLLPGISEELLEAVFMNGLDPLLRAEVRCFSPNGLDEMIRKALLVVEKYRVLQKISQESNGGTLGETIAPRTDPDSTYQTLSVTEYLSKKERGLCFRCDEKLIVGHKCRNRELRVFLVQDEEDEELPNNDTKPTETGDDVGRTAPGRMMFRVEIEDSEVVVLIGSGSTHNFVSQRLMEKLQLPLSDTPNYIVVLPTGATVEGKGIFKAVVLNLPGLTVIEDFIYLWT